MLPVSEGGMAGDGHENAFQRLPPTTWGPLNPPNMQHESSTQQYPGPCPKSLHLPDAPYTFGSTIALPSMPRWPSMINSQWKTQQQIRPRTLPQDRKTVSETLSTPNLASRKVMTGEERERMRAYAKDNPGATQQQIAGPYTFGFRNESPY